MTQVAPLKDWGSVLSGMKSLGECCTADGGSVLVVLRNGLVVQVF